MVPVNGKPMIERSIDALISAGIKKLVIGLGYKGDVLKNFITQTFSLQRLNGMTVEYVENPVYDTTNNIYSLYLAKDFFCRDDTILLESDLVYDADIISGLVRSPDKNLAVVSKFEPWMDGTCTQLDKDNYIIKFIDKDHFLWKDTGSYYKTVNIYKFSKDFITNHYLPFLDSYQTVYGKNEYYETVLGILARLEPGNLKGFSVSGDLWYEIDDPADLDIAENRFAEKSEKLARMQMRKGGAWRFPSLRDFSDTSNAFFPPPRLTEELKNSFDLLVTQPPSSRIQESLLAGKQFGILPEHITAGNSTIQLAQAASDICNGKTAVTGSAAHWFGTEHSKTVVISATGPDGTCTEEDIRSAANRDDVQMIFITNPDYTSGRFFSLNDILLLCRMLSEKNIYLVVDETYACFSDQDKRYTLFNEHILNEYPNLSVIASVCKQYGVPGLNLAVFASGSDIVMAAVTDRIPDRTINSVAEYIMQISGKYKKAYRNSLDAVARERHRLTVLLGDISGLEVISSQSASILFRLTGTVTATELAEILLQDYGIMVVPVHPCIQNERTRIDRWIKIAIRSEKDDDALITALRKELGR